MQRLTRARTVLALALVGALALAGCGGDDDNGVEQDLRDQVAMLEGELSDAETAKAAADAARMTAEAAATDAMTAQTAAEAERDAANTAKGAAEQAQTTAEAAQMTAEEAQTAAETAQMTAETAQAAAVQAQAVAEAGRDAATGTLSAAEMARDAAKDAEAAAKVAQAQAEALQMTAEADSADAMTAQAAAETAQMAAEAAQAAAETAEAAAEAKAADYKMMADDAMAAQTAADAKAAEYKMMADDAETARMAAVEAQTAADAKAAEYKMMADDAEAARMVAVEAQTAAEAKAEMYRQRVAELEGTADDDDTATAIDMAKKLNDALMGGGVEAYMDDDMEVEAMVRNMAVQPRTVTASIDGELSVTLEHVTFAGRESGAQLTGYDKANVPEEDEIDGWRGVTLTRGTAMAVVYSDIEDTAGGRFDNRYSSTLGMGVKRYAVTTDDAGNIPWTAVRRDTTATTITDNGADGNSPEDVHMFAGNVHDVSGMFSCVGAAEACIAVERLSDGKVTDPEVEWNFTPTDPDATIATVIDDKYLTFGWWLDRGDGTAPYYFDAFAAATGMGKNGDDPDTDNAVETALDATLVTSLQGTATYEGAAAGKYTILDANADTAEGGHFTASAMLEADFNAATDEAVGAPPNTNGVAITGMIDDFMTGATPRPGWEVKLMAGDTSADAGMQNYADLNSGVMGSTEWTLGGAAAPATGGWMADVYDGGMNDFPDAMTGTFNANGTTGRISGAFGVMEE